MRQSDLKQFYHNSKPSKTMPLKLSQTECALLYKACDCRVTEIVSDMQCLDKADKKLLNKDKKALLKLMDKLSSAS